MTTEERIAKIASKRVKLDAEHVAELRRREANIERYATRIKALAPRFDELISIAEALIQNKLPLGDSKRDIGGFYKDELVTEGINHHLGFYLKTTDYRTKELVGIGIAGGGACGHDIAIDRNGDMVVKIDANYASYEYDGYHDYCNKCEKILSGFDDFERRVHEYVDNL